MGDAQLIMLGYIRRIERHKMMFRELYGATISPHLKKGSRFDPKKNMPVSFDFEYDIKDEKVTPERFEEMKKAWGLN